MKRICLLIIALGGSLCMAQNADAPKEPPKFYKLDFVVKDLEDGKTVSTRSYWMVVQVGGRDSQLRAGTKIPIGGEPPQYADVGMSIDCSGVAEIHDELALRLSAEVSNVLPDTGPRPILRQNRWSSNVIVPLKKPTIVFSSDDNTTKHVLQLEVTATPRIESAHQ